MPTIPQDIVPIIPQDTVLEKVVAIPLRKRVAGGEGYVVRSPYEKSKRNFSSCSRGGSPGVRSIKQLNLPLPGRVLRVGQSQLRQLCEACHRRKGLLGSGRHRRVVFGVG